MYKDYKKIIGISPSDFNLLEEQIRSTCLKHLKKAEYDWEESNASELLMESHEERTMGLIVKDSQSFIPGHERVNPFSPKIDDFIAIVCDIRDSTNRLQIIDHSLKISGIQRIFFETSALLPAIETTINFFNGKVTEYLGDGVLGFIQYKSDAEVYKAYKISKACLSLTLDIVNEELYKKYELPPLQIGIGMAFSKAMIRFVTDNHIKAFGSCVWKASKLSCGRNKAYMDDFLKSKWPTRTNGLRFTRVTLKKSETIGYQVYPLH